VARADAELTAAALAEWVRVPDLESGPAKEDLATLAEWRERAEDVEEVYCAATPFGSVLLALAQMASGWLSSRSCRDRSRAHRNIVVYVFR